MSSAPASSTESSASSHTSTLPCFPATEVSGRQWGSMASRDQGRGAHLAVSWAAQLSQSDGLPGASLISNSNGESKKSVQDKKDVGDGSWGLEQPHSFVCQKEGRNGRFSRKSQNPRIPNINLRQHRYNEESYNHSIRQLLHGCWCTASKRLLHQHRARVVHSQSAPAQIATSNFGSATADMYPHEAHLTERLPKQAIHTLPATIVTGSGAN